MKYLVRLGSLALATVAACTSSDVSTGPPGVPIPITRLRAEPYSFTFVSGFDEPARLVIRDPLTWQAVWLRTFRGSSPIPPLPDVDFSKEVIVAVALGSHSTGGYGILIEGATEADASGINVVVRSVSPGSKCLVTDAFTQPVDLARLPRRSGPVNFVEHTEVKSCQ